METIWQSAISPDTGGQPSPASSLINGEVTQSIKLIPTNQSFIGAPAPSPLNLLHHGDTAAIQGGGIGNAILYYSI